MTPREAITFVRSPLGAFIAFLLLLMISYFLFVGTQTGSDPALPVRAMSQQDDDGSRQVVETVHREMAAFHPPGNVAPEGKPSPALPSRPSGSGKTLPPISLFAESPGQSPQPLEGLYAPFGRLIRCQLIVTVDSSQIATPIIGLVTDDVYHDGNLIIPAGTEVHGSARVDRSRERIASNSQWTLVWQTGEELPLNGIALDREDELGDGGWSITDGSAGLRGKLLKSDDLGEIKLFAATFLSGAASSLTEREQTLFGSRAAPSLRNAPLSGAQEVLNTYAKQLFDTIAREGFYVRVPAGKQFYLYVTEPIELSRSMIGSTRNALQRPGQSHAEAP